jgi:23S rRNA (guanine745-N1)-methyltransferase
VTAALDRSLEILACPLCAERLRHDSRSLTCSNRHDFNVARHGYASFTAGGGPHHHGDTAAMVAAREAFLGAGHYEPIADAIAAHAPAGDWVVELAGGTGYYIGRTLEARPGLEGLTIDVSTNAARVAAGAHPRLASATGDVHAVLPVGTGKADLVVSVFGPRRGDEVARILAPGASVVVVTPRPGHLGELREAFALLAIGADKQARLDETLLPLRPDGTDDLDYTATLSRSDVLNSIMMGPNAFHRDAAELEASVAAGPSTRTVTIAVTISRFRHDRQAART